MLKHAQYRLHCGQTIQLQWAISSPRKIKKVNKMSSILRYHNSRYILNLGQKTFHQSLNTKWNITSMYTKPQHNLLHSLEQRGRCCQPKHPWCEAEEKQQKAARNVDWIPRKFKENTRSKWERIISIIAGTQPVWHLFRAAGSKQNSHSLHDSLGGFGWCCHEEAEFRDLCVNWNQLQNSASIRNRFSKCLVVRSLGRTAVKLDHATSMLYFVTDTS